MYDDPAARAVITFVLKLSVAPLVAFTYGDVTKIGATMLDVPDATDVIVFFVNENDEPSPSRRIDVCRFATYAVDKELVDAVFATTVLLEKKKVLPSETIKLLVSSRKCQKLDPPLGTVPRSVLPLIDSVDRVRSVIPDVSIVTALLPDVFVVIVHPANVKFATSDRYSELR